MNRSKSGIVWTLLVSVTVAAVLLPGYAGAADKEDPVVLTYSAGPGGYILGAARQSVVAGSDGAPVRAMAASGYRFVEWSDGLASAARTDLAVAAPVEVSATFEAGVEDGPTGSVYFVKQSGAGDGSSWANAGSLQAMVNAAQPGDEVWVAAGFYTDTVDPVLALKAGVAVYGGFAGTETERWQRDKIANITMIFGEDQRRCVTGADGALIDGFMVIRGYAIYGGGMYNNAGTAVVANCAFIQNMATEDGGGMYNEGVNTIVVNCEFTKNTAFDDGGGLYNNFASPTLTNCTFYDNKAETGYGGGVYSNREAPVITNCTIHKNQAVLFGGGLSSQSASPVVTNCIIWGNIEIEEPGKADVNGGTPIITYSCIEGGYAGEGNIDANPMFVDDLGHLSLQPGSPCLNIGTAVGAPGADILGVYRPQGGGHDMGAYELDETPPTVTIDQAAGQADPTNDTPILFTAVFSEPVSGFITGDVSLSGTASASTGTVTGYGALYSVAVSGMANPGTVIADIVAGRCVDQAGNANVASTSTDNLVIYGSHTLTYLAGAGGSIEGDPDQSVFYSYDGAEVLAQPDTGYHFVGWSDGFTEAARTDTNVTADITVTALFEINTYTLTYLAGANGAIDGPTPQAVNHGSNGTAVTAVAAEGYHFVDWSDGRTDTPRTDTNVTGPLTVTANFVINTYPLTYLAGPNGSISGPAEQLVNHGGNGEAVTAAPAEGYHFVDWSDGRTDTPRTDTNVTGPLTVTANFAINTYTLAYLAGENGSISGPSPQTVPYSGSGEAVTAVPASGYHFVNWSDGRTDNPRTDGPVTGDLTVTALFAEDIAEGEGEAPAEGEPEPAEGEAVLVVPDVVLLPLEGAGAAVANAGLVVGEVAEECSDDVPAGAVISQEPVAGTIVEALTPVNLVVSTGECPCSCGAFCTFNWGNLFLGALAVLVLVIISLFTLGGGSFPK